MSEMFKLTTQPFTVGDLLMLLRYKDGGLTLQEIKHYLSTEQHEEISTRIEALHKLERDIVSSVDGYETVIVGKPD